MIFACWLNCADAPQSNGHWRISVHVTRDRAAPVRALSDAGVIERTIAVLSPERLGSTVTAIAGTLDVQNADTFAAFARLIEPEPAVMLAWQTAPTVDFTLVLTVRDMPDYQALVQRLFTGREQRTQRSRPIRHATGEVFNGVTAAGDRSQSLRETLNKSFTSRASPDSGG